MTIFRSTFNFLGPLKYLKFSIFHLLKNIYHLPLLVLFLFNGVGFQILVLYRLLKFRHFHNTTIIKLKAEIIRYINNIICNS